MINIKLFLERKDIPVKIDVVRNTNAIPISFHIADYQIPEGTEARIYLHKPSGAEVYNSAAIEENAVIVQPTMQMYAEEGEAIGQLQIIKDTTVAASFAIVFCIHKNIISDSAIESKDEFGILDTLINQAREEIKNAQNATSAANTAAESATTAANAANTGAEAATSAAESATTAADAANAGAEAATSAATSANAAADRANEAAGNIEQANIKPLAYSVSGESITAGNSAEKPLIGLTVHGRAEQGSTTGAQLINTTGVSKTENGVTFTVNSDGTINAKGTATAHVYILIGRVTLQSGQYTLSGCPQLGGQTKYQLALIGTVNSYNAGEAKTFNVTETIEEEVRFYVYSGTTVDFTVKPMLNAGSSALPWEPYTGGAPSPSTEYPQEFDIAGNSGSISVNVAGANLFDISKVQSISLASGAQITNNNDGTLSVQSSQTGTSGGYEDGKNVLRDLCPELRVGDVVVLSLKSTGWDKRIYLRRSRYLWASGTSRTISETDLDSIVMFYASGTSTSATISEIMINAGSVALPYEPYKTPQSVSLSTPNGLAGLKVSSGGNYTDASGQQWICDEIVRNERGTGKLIQRIGRSKVADNTLYLTTLSNGNKALVVSEVPNKIGAVTGALFTMAPIKAWGSADIDKTGSAYENTANFVIVGTPDDTLETLTSKYGNCEFLYVLETPVETNLSDEEIAVLSALHTYNPATTISNDAGCEMTAAYVTQYYQGVGDAMFYGVADNLTTEASGTSVLDAHQGEILKGLLDDIWKTIYPVGSIYMSVNNTDPGTLFGGTWEAWGTGRVPVGVDSGDSDFSTAEKIGGEKRHILSNGEIPSVTGSFYLHGSSDGSCIANPDGCFAGSDINTGHYREGGTSVAANSSAIYVRFNNGGEGQSHNNLQPYITCYMWKRTA